MGDPGRREPYSREIWGWAFYDFANSAYSTALAGVIFSVYFVQVVVGQQQVSFLGSHLGGTALWGYSVSFSMVLVALTAPVLGAVADCRAAKKPFLFWFCYAGVIATAFLFLVGPGDIWLGVALYVGSNLALESSLVFYNGFLPEISSPRELGRISGFGWALGYVGGVFCLLLTLLLMRGPEWFGLSADNYLPVRVSLLLVALWWGLFSIPTFLWLKERPSPPRSSSEGYLRMGFRRLYHTLRRIGQYRELVRFLIAFLLYNDGVQTVITMAAVFGAQELGMSQQELIPCFILTHVVAFFGSLLFGYLGDRWTTKAAIHLSLAIWTGAIIYVLWITEVWEFWLLAAVVGFVLGGVQASSRALIARFTPAGNSAEFFGFFSTGGKFASIFGPALFALTTEITGTVRFGVASVVVFFVAGWAIFFFVDESRGIEESRVRID